MKKIAIQGIAGSFHHAAAQKFFGKDIEIVPCDFFKDTALLLRNRQVDYTLMAIENSIAGAILPNYNLIEKNNLTIIGEVFLPIHHQLMALPGTSLREVKHVGSHPMALLQCIDFLEQHPHWNITEEKDTALMAKAIAENHLTGTATIASAMAAETYGLQILVHDIHTFHQNYTRFFVLSNEERIKSDKNNKVSLHFSILHQTGKLNHILEKLAKEQLNLTKIQSVPIMEHPWEYRFYVDFVFDDRVHLENALAALQKETTDFKILGEYQNARGK